MTVAAAVALAAPGIASAANNAFQIGSVTDTKGDPGRPSVVVDANGTGYAVSFTVLRHG